MAKAVVFEFQTEELVILTEELSVGYGRHLFPYTKLTWRHVIKTKNVKTNPKPCKDLAQTLTKIQTLTLTEITLTLPKKAKNNKT